MFSNLSILSFSLILHYSYSKSSAGGVAKALKQMLKHHAGQTLSLLATPLKVLVQLESSGKWCRVVKCSICLVNVFIVVFVCLCDQCIVFRLQIVCSHKRFICVQSNFMHVCLLIFAFSYSHLL